MKRIVILGGGTAGTMMAHKLVRLLPRDQWEVTVVDRDDVRVREARAGGGLEEEAPAELGVARLRGRKHLRSAGLAHLRRRGLEALTADTELLVGTALLATMRRPVLVQVAVAAGVGALGVGPVTRQAPPVGLQRGD